MTTLSADFLTLARQADDDGDVDLVTCQCLRMLQKFSKSKKDLLAGEFDSGKRPRFDRRECLAGKRARDGKEPEKLPNRGHGKHVTDGWRKEE